MTKLKKKKTDQEKYLMLVLEMLQTIIESQTRIVENQKILNEDIKNIKVMLASL